MLEFLVEQLDLGLDKMPLASQPTVATLVRVIGELNKWYGWRTIQRRYY
jgi:hypothetical protein